MKKILLLLCFILWTSFGYSQTTVPSTDVNGYKTFYTNAIGADATIPKRYEIARIFTDVANWSLTSPVEIDLDEFTYAIGAKRKYSVYFGYPNYYKLIQTEINEPGVGGRNNFQLLIGEPVVVNGTLKYLPIYVDVQNYANVKALIKTGRPITTNQATGPTGSIYINTAPLGATTPVFTADNTVQISTGASSTILTGKVGIGTTTPKVELQVNGSARILNNLNVGDSLSSWTPFNVNQKTPYIYSARFAHSGTTEDRQLSIGYLNGAMGIWASTFSGGNAANLLLNSAGGNVVIGNTTADAKFRVTSPNADFRIDYNGAGQNYYDGSNYHCFRDNAGNNKFLIYSNLNATYSYNNFTIFTKTGTGLAIQNTNTASEWNYTSLIGSDSKRSHYYGSDPNKNFIIGSDNPTQNLFITNFGNTVFQNGNVGVGTPLPLAKLHVAYNGINYSSILSEASETAFNLYTKSISREPYAETFRLGLKWNTEEKNGFISFYRGGDSQGGFLGFSTDGTERMSINKEGNIGIGTKNPTQRLSVIGQGVFGSSGASSDPGDGFGSAVRVGYSTAGDYGYILANNTGVAGKNLILQSNGNGGNVGIGTFAPTNKLEIASGNATSGLTFTGLKQTVDGPKRNLGVNAAGEVVVVDPSSSGAITFTVGGEADKYYPVVFSESEEVWNKEISEFTVSHANVHADGLWWGSAVAKFRFHSNRWGHGSNFLEPVVYQYKLSSEAQSKYLIAGWKDTPLSADFIVWMRGKTTYAFKGNTFGPKVYDGVQNPLPYKEISGAGSTANTYTYTDHNPKTTVEPYVEGNPLPTWKKDGSNLYNGNSGNVGIGTATPSALLDANGMVRSIGVNVPTSGTGAEMFLNNGIAYFGGYNRSAGGAIDVNVGFTNQLYLKNNGNIGVGTTTPTNLLTINSKIDKKSGLTFSNIIDKTVSYVGDRVFPLGVNLSGEVVLNEAANLSNVWTTTGANISNTNGGNIGIGTTTPTAIYGKTLEINNEFGGSIHLKSPTVQSYYAASDGLNGGLIGTGSAHDFNIITSSISRILVKANGAVGIGATTMPAGYKLAVGGDIIAERVVVKLQSSGWPDYVFSPTYQRASLSELEQYILQHKHLPNIPSAQEVGEKGLDVGAMNAKVMEKIEELTLYMIELQKQNELLKKQNETLLKRVDGLDVQLKIKN